MRKAPSVVGKSRNYIIHLNSQMLKTPQTSLHDKLQQDETNRHINVIIWSKLDFATASHQKETSNIDKYS